MVIGIVGQPGMSVGDQQRCRAQCGAALQALQQRYPQKKLEVMSALASRAERTGAEAALALGLRVIVLLPADMVSDDNTPADCVIEYRNLLAHIPLQDFQIPSPDTHGQESASGVAGLSLLVTAECHVLLAFWDGGPSIAPGDTTALIGAKLRPTEHGLAETVGGPVLHMPMAEKPDQLNAPLWMYPEARRSAPIVERRKRQTALI